MKHLVYTIIFSMALSPTIPPLTAFADDEEVRERREERIQTRITEHRKDITAKKRESSDVARELVRARTEAEIARKKLEKFETDNPAAEYGKRTPAQEAEMRRLEEEAARKEARREELQARLDGLKSEELTIKTEIETYEEQIERLYRKTKKKDEDCTDCDTKKAAPNQGKGGWEVFADVLKAATPLGLGAMGLYGGIQGMKYQSGDYRFYAGSMAQQGLPFAPPSNNYGGILGSAMGPAFMSSMFMNGFGGMGGGMFGGPQFGGGMYGGGFPNMGGGGFVGGFGFVGGGGMSPMGMGFAPYGMGGGFAPMGMGMGYAPYGMGGGFAPMGMGMGYAPYGMGGGFAPMGMGMGGMPYGMGGGFAPMGMGGGFAIGSAFAAGGGFAPMGMGMGGMPYGMGGGFAPYGMGGGFAPMGMGMGGMPYGMGGGFAPMGMGGGFAIGSAFAAGGGFAPMGMGMGGMPYGMGGGFAPIGGGAGFVAGGGFAPYGAQFGGGAFAPIGGGFAGMPGGYPGMPGGYPGMPGGMPGGYPGMPGGFPYGQPGFPGQQYPYANPMYGQNPSCYGGLCNYNPYMSTYNGQYNAGGMGAFYQHQQQQMQAQIRTLQQQALLSQDAQVASQALSEAQNRYTQVVSQMNGSYYPGGHIGYGGAGYTPAIPFPGVGGALPTTPTPPLTPGRL